MNYFNIDIYKPKVDLVNIKPILIDNMTLISGDFWGIQKFIFERLSTKNASKILRAKSAFIQIFTEYIVKYICDKLSIDEKNILSMNAGKFEILAPFNISNIDDIQTTIDNYFRENFYGINGIKLSVIKCKREDFTDENRYRVLRDITIPNQIERDKFSKFSLDKNSPLMEYDTNINNQTLCKICNIRKAPDKKSCDICKKFIELGWKLTKREPQHFNADFFDNFKTSILLTKKIKAYIPREKDKYEALDFSDIANNSCGGKDEGIKALGVLKADVDNMGLFLKDKENSVTENFENFDSFSKGLDSFFSEYIVDILRDKNRNYRNIYTVFTGGDDLFLIGAWDEVLAFSRFIQKEFKKYVKYKLTISFGIAITKPTTPISYLARHSEDLLEKSKDVEGKDAITLFGESVKWKSYLEVYNKLYCELENFEKHLNTAFLYRLLELIKMSKKVKYENDIPSTMWKSKFRYLVNRNIGDKAKKEIKEMIEDLSKFIETRPKETKMVVNEFIYKRREV